MLLLSVATHLFAESISFLLVYGIVFTSPFEFRRLYFLYNHLLESVRGIGVLADCAAYMLLFSLENSPVLPTADLI